MGSVEKAEKTWTKRDTLKWLVLVSAGAAVSGAGYFAKWAIDTPEGHAWTRDVFTKLLGRSCGEVFIQAAKERLQSGSSDTIFPDEVFRIALRRDQHACIAARGLIDVKIDPENTVLKENLVPGVDVFEARDVEGNPLMHQLLISPRRTALIGVHTTLHTGDPEATLYAMNNTTPDDYLLVGGSSPIRNVAIGAAGLDASFYEGNAFQLPTILNGQMQEIVVGGNRTLPTALALDTITLIKRNDGSIEITYFTDESELPVLEGVEFAIPSPYPLILDGEVIGRFPSGEDDVPFIPKSDGTNMIRAAMMEIIYGYYTSQVNDSSPVVYGITAEGKMIISVLGPNTELSSALHFMAAEGVIHAFGNDLAWEPSVIVRPNGNQIFYKGITSISPAGVSQESGFNVIYVRRP